MLLLLPAGNFTWRGMVEFTPDPFRYWPAPAPSRHLLQSDSMGTRLRGLTLVKHADPMIPTTTGATAKQPVEHHDGAQTVSCHCGCGTAATSTLVSSAGGPHRALLQSSTGLQDVAANTQVVEVTAAGSNSSAMVVVPGQTSKVDEEMTVQVPADYTGPGITLLQVGCVCWLSVQRP
jgi:hypothetical protein